MCGIVGAIAQRDVAEILLEGLRRLEYRGYDSAGLAISAEAGQLTCLRRVGKVQALAEAIPTPLAGGTGIAHTRWATHGEPSERNAHPHISRESIAVVHNGIIENHQALRKRLKEAGYQFDSDTDTEVITHLVHENLQRTGDLLSAVQASLTQLRGAYGTVVLDAAQPERLIAARSGSPLVIGLGIGENFVASDALALLPVTHQFIYLEEGDVAEIKRDSLSILNAQNQPTERPIQENQSHYDAGDKGEYRHYMLKEIYEQPKAIAHTLEGRLFKQQLNHNALGDLSDIENVQIIACGTSYHAGLVARYWIESLAGLA